MDYFFKHHLIMTSQLRGKSESDRKSYLPPSFHIEECDPNIAYFDFVLQRVGGLWGWADRPKYKYETDSLQHRLLDNQTRLFNFKKGEKLIGYCLVSASEEEVASQYRNLIEIENFGFFPEYTGKGYGNYFLQAVFDELLKDYDTVYLSTRSTNHHKVVPFYQKNGMVLVKSERKMNDLVQESLAKTA